MTIITKVGVSSVHHINDDVLEVNRVSHQAFSLCFAYCKQSKTGGGEVLGMRLGRATMTELYEKWGDNCR